MIKLSKISTKPPKGIDKEKIVAETQKLAQEIGEMVETMYAQKKYSLLVILQGMDGSGKDGAFKKVFANTMHACVDYISYKKPTDDEFAHDFLWRIHKNAPAKGMVQGFIRSHYEDILIQRVHNWIDDKRVANRMKAINAFEQLLESENNTKVLKFMMHISPERQLEKLIERIEVPSKNWKHKDGDWEERKLWDEYMKAYEYAINNSEIPWNIIPVDSRSYRDYCIAKIVHATLKKMDLKYPSIPESSKAKELLASVKNEKKSESSNDAKSKLSKNETKPKASNKKTSKPVKKETKPKPSNKTKSKPAKKETKPKPSNKTKSKPEKKVDSSKKASTRKAIKKTSKKASTVKKTLKK